MSEAANRRRFYTNLLIALGMVLCVSIALAAVGLARGLRRDPGEIVSGLVAATFFLGILATFVVVPYLLLLEVLARRIKHRRTLAVVLGPLVLVVLLFVSQLGAAFDSGRVGDLFAVLGVVALYGLAVRLPPTHVSEAVPRTDTARTEPQGPATPRDPDLRRGVAIGLTVVLGILVIAIAVVWSWGPSAAPAEVILENNRSEPVIIELEDGRAWEVPPDGWGPTVEVEPGTRGTIYTSACEPIKQVTFERNGGFIVNPGEVREFSFSDITTTTVEHSGCT